MNGRVIEVRPDEILVGSVAYPKTIEPLEFPDGINPDDFVLNTWNDENFALSNSQKLNGLDFDNMIKTALGSGQFLARVRDVTPLFRDVNSALRGEGVVYDASGKVIENERLTQLGNFVNTALVYLNDRFEK